MDDINAPIYYAVSNSLTPQEIEDVLHYVSITPISSAIITSEYDGELAAIFSQNIYRSSSDKTHELAKELYETTGSPVIIIGGAEYFDAYCIDGTSYSISRASL